jgi:hypothetical protein
MYLPSNHKVGSSQVLHLPGLLFRGALLYATEYLVCYYATTLAVVILLVNLPVFIFNTAVDEITQTSECHVV